MSHLYLIIHPEQHPDQPFTNKWHDDNRPAWIYTTVDIAELCEEGMEKGERLFIHRSGVSGGDNRRISCSAKVMDVGKPRQGRVRVEFGDYEVMNCKPPRKAVPGMSFYHDKIPI